MDLIRTKESGHYREGGHSSGVAIKRGSTVASAVAAWAVSGLPSVKSNDAERENFFVQVEWLPLTSLDLSQTDSRTNLRLELFKWA